MPRELREGHAGRKSNHTVHGRPKYIQGDPPPKKKTEPIYFWLEFINIILAFSFFQDMK